MSLAQRLSTTKASILLIAVGMMMGLLIAGCDGTPPAPVAPDVELGPVALLVAPHDALSAGDTLRVTMSVDSPGVPIAGLLGDVQFDPAALSFRRALGTQDVLVAFGQADTVAGTVPVAAIATTIMPRWLVTLTFVARRAAPAGSVPARWLMRESAWFSLQRGQIASTARGARAGSPPSQRLVASAAPSRRVFALPAAGRYGDVTADSVVSLTDALQVVAWAVGLAPPPHVGSLDEVLANVHPYNSALGGGASDSDGPGWEPACARVINLTDALAIIAYVVNLPSSIVGQDLPGDWLDAFTREPWLPDRCVAGP